MPAPYYPAVEADAQQARQLAGLERARPVWHVEGEDGIAYVELEPTTASGTVTLRFAFRDGEQRPRAARSKPGSIRASGRGRSSASPRARSASTGSTGNMERLGESDDDVITDGRLALYARGRISGRWLMTLAYDSDKQRGRDAASAA